MYVLHWITDIEKVILFKNYFFALCSQLTVELCYAVGRNISAQFVRKLSRVSMVDHYDSFDPVLLADHQGDPRIIDTIFNVSSLTSGIFNNSLFQYAGLVIVGIILLGKSYKCSSQAYLLFNFLFQTIRNFHISLTLPSHHNSCLKVWIMFIYVTSPGYSRTTTNLSHLSACASVPISVLFSEIALYALDVYYNQTYLNQSSKLKQSATNNRCFWRWRTTITLNWPAKRSSIAGRHCPCPTVPRSTQYCSIMENCFIHLQTSVKL